MRPKKTILCIDDNEQTLTVRKFMLETRGYRVLIASHSETALAIFRQGGIDLVLSDLSMPYMDGNELVRRMKELSPEVPMILISGSIKEFSRADRADAFLPKGACTALEVLERIRLLIARRRGPRKATAPPQPPCQSAAPAERSASQDGSSALQPGRLREDPAMSMASV
ncbi:MAG TPA: response regulator [Acidisarcina sp.]